MYSQWRQSVNQRSHGRVNLLTIQVYIDKNGFLNYKVDSVPNQAWNTAIQELAEDRTVEASFYTDLFNIMGELAYTAQKRLGRFIK